jgi:hypothetical protein
MWGTTRRSSGPSSAQPATSAVARGLNTGHNYAVVGYTVYQYGNVSRPVERTITF